MHVVAHVYRVANPIIHNYLSFAPLLVLNTNKGFVVMQLLQRTIFDVINVGKTIKANFFISVVS